MKVSKKCLITLLYQIYKGIIKHINDVFRAYCAAPCGQKNQLLWIEFQKVIILFSTPSNGVKTAWIVIIKIKIKLALCIFRNCLVPGEFSSQSGLMVTKVKYISPHGGS